MKNKITSVLTFPYNNKLEVRVSRSLGFNQPLAKINIYSASYRDIERVYRLADLAGKLNTLVVKEMVKLGVQIGNPIK